MKQLRSIGVFSALVGLWCWLGPAGVPRVSQAETMRPSETIKTEFQYAAKVVCSLLLPHQDGTLASGTYRTIVNIHNPTGKQITVAAKVALATDFGSEPGPFDVTPFKKADLQPDGAVKLSCFDIAGYFCPIDGVCVDFAFLEGFLVIKSPVPLDVVGVYTARHTDGEVETMDVEAVRPKQIREMVKLMPRVAKPEIKKRIEYPPKGSPAYGGKDQPKQICGGIAGFPCPDGKVCVDDPSDDCDATKGGADCSGICVSRPAAK
ncbi:MAG: Kazal-type serine protease inhibitor domain protein [Gammaproteobacteria bacterium]